MNGRKISVIVPVYNVERYLPRCLNSICDQTYHNLEIILIDDGSSDYSGRICDEYAAQDERITVIHKKNGGVSAARNDGLDAAKGDFITFVDSDDYIAPRTYEMLMNLLSKANADIAICNFIKENCYGDLIPYWKGNGEVVLSQQEQLECLLTNKFFCCSIGEMLFKREHLTGIRFDITKKHNEDLLFIYEVMKKTTRSVYTSEPMYYYCYNESSASNSKFSEAQMAIIDVSEYIYSDIKQWFPELRKIEMEQYVRNNLTVAMQIVNSDYRDKASIQRIRSNIRKELSAYLHGSASKGYKVGSFLAAWNWFGFSQYAKYISKKQYSVEKV